MSTRTDNFLPLAVATSLVVTLICTATACDYDPIGAVHCESSSDCPETAECVANRCVATDQSGTVVEITIEPSQPSMRPGDERQLTARALDEEGVEISGVEFDWATNDPTVAEVDAVGVVTAVGVGQTSITASAGGSVGTSSVTVVNPVDRIVLQPPTLEVGVGVTKTIEATLFDARDNELKDREIEWMSDDPGVAEVDDQGNVTGRAVGVTTVTAQSEGVSASVSVTVAKTLVETAEIVVDMPVGFDPTNDTIRTGALVRLAAVLKDDMGNPIDPSTRDVRWESSRLAVATVTPASGGKTTVSGGQTDGTATITMTLTQDDDGTMVELKDTVDITVIKPVGESVTIMPQDPVVPLGSTLQFTTEVIAQDGLPVQNRPHTWSSSEGGVASIDMSTGELEALAQGTTEVSVDVDGATDSVTVEVQFLLDSIVTGDDHTCGLNPDGIAFCWGENGSGSVGNDSTSKQTLPALVKTTQTFVQLTAGVDFTCGIAETSGDAYCWGVSDDGRLGSNAGADALTPSLVAGPETYAVIAAGHAHVCAVTTQDEVLCWGINGSGQIGNDTTDPVTGPTSPMLPSGKTWIDVAAGDAHSCAVEASGAVYCWGLGDTGQLGDDQATDSPVPVEVVTSESFESVVAGTAFTCGLNGNGDAFCWGSNAEGRLGIGNEDTAQADVPMAVADMTNFDMLSASFKHACGVAGDTAYCWGKAGDDRLGTNQNDTSKPEAVLGSESWMTVAAGQKFSCGVDVDGTAFCWGKNDQDQLGTGGGNVGEPSQVYPP